MDLLAEKNATESPILFYFWTPHAVHKLFDLVRVQLPNNGTIYSYGVSAWYNYFLI
jgi:ABC-type proline/glycine betaine transport system substrate-binding protein